MDRIQKALQKLTTQEREWVRDVLRAVSTGATKNLDIKKLKGREDIFRIRKGRVRILYRKDNKGDIRILAIERRDDNTYN